MLVADVFSVPSVFKVDTRLFQSDAGQFSCPPAGNPGVIL